MTHAYARPPWLPMLAAGALLASALVFLYAKTRSYDPSGYFENVALLRQIKQLDAQWELDAMKSKIGINKTYDPLIDPLLDLNGLPQKMSAFAANQQGGDAGALESSMEAFQAALQQKTRSVEDFKTHNAVLRNSLAFLPTAAQDVSIWAGQDDGAEAPRYRGWAAQVNQVLLACLVYDQAASEEKAAEIDAALQRIVNQTRNAPAEFRNRVDVFAAHARTLVREHGVVTGLLNSIAAAPTARRLDTVNGILNDGQRRSSEQAQTYRLYLLLLASALSGLLLYAAVRLLRSHAVINQVNAELQSANETLEQRVQARTRELGEAQAKLVTAARQAGMAEVATNVLHNVGNVLNSVNISAGLVASQLRTSKLPGLVKATELMGEHTHELADFLVRDPKGKLVPDYLAKVAQVLATEHQVMLDELMALGKNVDHIKEIVATQQSYAGAASSVLEPVRPSEVADEALRICAASLSRNHAHVSREFDDIAAVPLDKHRLLQILVNLISNAKHAVEAVTDGREHRITVRLAMLPGPVLRIQVADNGEGIAAENLVKIFAHGFTTKAGGHGFGLHSCVLAAREMGGSLRAHSDGPGQGATFTLELPVGPD